VPSPGPPGLECRTSRRPSLLRDEPSRPPVVRTLAVYRTLLAAAVADMSFPWEVWNGCLVAPAVQQPLPGAAIARWCRARRAGSLVRARGAGRGACRHERGRPPVQLVEHRLRIGLEVAKVGQVPLVLEYGHEIGTLQVYAGPRRRHLQLDAD